MTVQAMIYHGRRGFAQPHVNAEDLEVCEMCGAFVDKVRLDKNGVCIECRSGNSTAMRLIEHERTN